MGELWWGRGVGGGTLWPVTVYQGAPRPLTAATGGERVVGGGEQMMRRTTSCSVRHRYCTYLYYYPALDTVSVAVQAAFDTI